MSQNATGELSLYWVNTIGTFYRIKRNNLMNGLLNLLLGGWTLYAGLSNLSNPFLPMFISLSQTLLGAGAVCVSLWALLSSHQKTQMGFSVILALMGLHNVLIVAFYGAGIMTLYWGLLQFWWAWRMYESYKYLIAQRYQLPTPADKAAYLALKQRIATRAPNFAAHYISATYNQWGRLTVALTERHAYIWVRGTLLLTGYAPENISWQPKQANGQRGKLKLGLHKPTSVRMSEPDSQRLSAWIANTPKTGISQEQLVAFAERVDKVMR